MRFVRRLNTKFIDELNRLHAEEGSWWYKMVEDEKAFILVRNNRLHILVNGGLLLQVGMDAQGVNCRTHTDFLSLPREADPYVRLSDKETPSIERVRGLIGLADHYQKVKNRVKTFTGQEKQVVQDIGTKYKEIIDLEVGLEGEQKPDTLRKGSQRVDMVVVSENGTLVFFEVKLFDNSEIRSDETPRVVGQLKEYEDRLNKYRAEIQNGYREQFKVYEELKGRFFSQKRRQIGELRVYPTVRLVITGFDGSQQKYLLPIIKEGIKKGMGLKEKSDDLIAVSNHQNIKMEVLLKGIS